MDRISWVELFYNLSLLLFLRLQTLHLRTDHYLSMGTNAQISASHEIDYLKYRIPSPFYRHSVRLPSLELRIFSL